MAINTLNNTIKHDKGITITATTDTSADWPSVSNDSYFYDLDTDLPYYKNASGTVISLFEEGATVLNDLTDVNTGLPVSPTTADDGKLLFYDHAVNEFITDDAVTHGTVIINGKKSTAGTIAKGLPVYLVGFDSDLHTVELANANSSLTMPVIGFTAEQLDDTNSKHITTFGKLTGIDTTSTVSTLNPNGETWAVNDALYMSITAGGLTKVRPTGGTTSIQRIAKVLKVDATGGQIFIFNTARTAGLPNLGTDKLWIGDANGIPQEVDKSTLTPILGKTMTLQEPTSSDDITIFRTDVDITAQEIILVSTGTTPSTTYQLKFGSDRSAAGTNLTLSGITTSTTTGDIATIANANIPANSWVWLETTAASGTNVYLTIDIRFTED